MSEESEVKESEVMLHIIALICSKIHTYDDMTRGQKGKWVTEARKLKTPASAITFIQNYDICGVTISESLVSQAFAAEMTIGKEPPGDHKLAESKQEEIGVPQAHGRQAADKGMDKGELPSVTNPVRENGYQKADPPFTKQGWEIGISQFNTEPTRLAEAGTLVQRETCGFSPAGPGLLWAATGTGAVGSFADPEKAPNIKHWFMQAEIAQQSPASVPIRQILTQLVAFARGRVHGGKYKWTRDKDRGPYRAGLKDKDNPTAMLPSRHC